MKKLPIDISFGSMAYSSLLGPPHVQQQQASANGDGAVGDVEGRKIMRAGVDFDKIGHRAVDNSIIQVSERAAQNETQRNAQQGVALARGPQQHEGNRDQNSRGKSDQQNVAPDARERGEHAEGDARIFGVDDIEQARNNADGIVGRNVGPDEALADTVQQHHDNSDQERKQPLTHYLIAPLHGAQMVGNSGSLPTSSVYFQQRSHLTPSARWISTETPFSVPCSNRTCETMNNAGRSDSY